MLDQDQLKSGKILACQTRLKSDIEVVVELEDAEHAHQVLSFEGSFSQMLKILHTILKKLLLSLNIHYQIAAELPGNMQS